MVKRNVCQSSSRNLCSSNSSRISLSVNSARTTGSIPDIFSYSLPSCGITPQSQQLTNSNILLHDEPETLYIDNGAIAERERSMSSWRSRQQNRRRTRRK